MESRPYKIAFLHLEEIHQIYHFVTVAIALAQTQEVSILTYPGKHTLLKRALEVPGGEKVQLEMLTTQAFRAFTDLLKKRELPRKGFWIKKNKRYLLHHFDALVFTDFYHRYILEARGQQPFPKLIKFPHGTPGRGYSYKPDQKDFDFQLLVGAYHYQQLSNLSLLGPCPKIIGYPKLDAVNKEKKTIFENGRPTVLYNPHFSVPYSSWHGHGLEILEYFYHKDTFNLIFAPHINLFKIKGGERIESIPSHYFEAPHMHIDIGSEASVDMTYVKAANIYLGDVSSQVYEFIIEPRPCLFFNTEGISWKENPNYRFWQCGEVAENLRELIAMLPKAFDRFQNYRAVQERITRENFYMENGSTPSQRAAREIIAFLDRTSS